MRRLRLAFLSLMLWLVAQAQPAWACAACYGQSDSPMAQGMNWGILSLLVIIGLVLAGVAGFFVFLIKRAGTVAAAGTAPLLESPERA